MQVQLVQLIQFVPITRIAALCKQPSLPSHFCPDCSGGPRGLLARVEHLFVSGAKDQVNAKDPLLRDSIGRIPDPS
jgi:hypothetical protein